MLSIHNHLMIPANAICLYYGGMWRIVVYCGVLCIVYGVVYGVWCMVFNVYNIVYGVWCTMYSAAIVLVLRHE